MSSRLPLDGIRAVDFGVGGVGPWAGSQLAQMGATVIRIEAPADFILSVLPPWHELTTTFVALNLGKRSARLNLKDERDRECVWRLVERADVLVENFRSGVMDRLGLGFESVAARNPGIVYCCSSGFGREGEMAGLPCTDPHIQAFSGLSAHNGREGGERMRYYASVDLYCSAVIVEAVLAGLVARGRGGGPQWIEMTMLGGATSLQLTRLAEHLGGAGPVPAQAGGSGFHCAPDGLYRARDGIVAITVGGDESFSALTQALGRPELAADPRFAAATARLANRAELDAELAAELGDLPAEWVVTRLGRAGVTCARALSDREVLAHRDMWERGHLQVVHEEAGRRLVAAGPPWDFEGVEPARPRIPDPGRETEAVLAAADPWAALESLP
jgi:crotonobetainyl-CoA:carnitine CoA-transferase CaiB-like acyl-CoA transferase